MRLNDTIIRNARPSEKPRKLSDGNGLYLLVQPTGARWWRMKYFVNGVEKMLSVGVYPEISLQQARKRREEIREQIASGTDPGVKRKADKRASANTFETVAREWWGKRKQLWSEEYASAVITRFEQDIKDEAVRLVLQEKLSTPEAGRRLEISDKTLANWVRLARAG